MKNQQNFVEEKVTSIFKSIFRAPLNIGSIAIAAAMWLFVFSFAYNAQGDFDIFLSVMNYIILTSIASILVGKLGSSGNSAHIVNLGITSLLLGVFGIISFKVFMLSPIGYLVVCPVSFFVFTLLLKALWEGL